MTTRRAILSLPAAGSLALLLPASWVPAGCAGLGGPPTVTLTEREIARLVEQNFPLERRLLEVLDVTVSAPRVRLLPERNRLAAVVDIGTRDRLFGSRWSGQLDFDSALRFEPRDQSVRLSQVRVQDLKMTSAGGDSRTPLERLGGALAERVLEDMSLYTLSPERIEQARKLGVSVAAVTVTARGLEITFTSATH